MEDFRIGSRCGAFSRIRSLWAATSLRSSSSLGRRVFASSTVKSLGKEGSTFSSSATVRQPVGEHTREVGGPDLGLGLLHVVLDEAVGDPGSVLRVLGEDVGGEDVAVPRLADGARVDEVGPARCQIQDIVGAGGGAVGGGHDGLYVRVSEEADPNVRVLRPQDVQILLRYRPVEDVLVWIAYRPVHEESPLLVLRAWRRAQKISVLLCELLSCPLDGRRGDRVEPGQVRGEVR